MDYYHYLKTRHDNNFSQIGITYGFLNSSGDYLKTLDWFATRSDLIILMFDPMRVTTTGELNKVMDLLIPNFEKVDERKINLLSPNDYITFILA